MSRICQGCGGVLGRDCYNEAECIEITRHMEDANFVVPYMDALKESRDVLNWMADNLDCPQHLIETYTNTLDNILNRIDELIPIERTPEQIQQDMDDLPF